MNQLLDQVLEIAIQAGKEILDVYENEFEVDYKGDGSPLTIADRRAHALIVEKLQVLDADIPILSEESEESVLLERLKWSRYWLVDPLDGTKEFVKRNGEFTVNIALIDNKCPILGVVHTPVSGISHFAANGVGAFKKEVNGEIKTISVRVPSKNQIVMVASRSHSGVEVEQFRHGVEEDLGSVDIASMGSSLKICLVAEGSADIYPRMGLTSEWDTAAAHCVLNIAGGSMIDLDGKALIYNKNNILNPWFLACGGEGIDWIEYVDDASRG
jgi:3'(2'), 5'-bisphosphate nucleotidase